MLAKRSLSLASSAVLTESILRREHLLDVQRAGEVLRNAHDQAAQILDDAREEGLREREQALAQFWDAANQTLQNLEQQRQTLQSEAMNAVEELLNTTLARLLDETSLAERTRALVRNLADSQRFEAVAVLSAHPGMLADLTQWLAESRFAEHWQLKADPLMAPQTLRLSDDNGAFDIDWPALRRGLLGGS